MVPNYANALQERLGAKNGFLKMQASGTPYLKRQEAIPQDLQQFVLEISVAECTVPVIGGGVVDIFALIPEVLLLCDLRNGVKKRAFRIGVQEPCFWKICTLVA